MEERSFWDICDCMSSNIGGVEVVFGQFDVLL